MNHARNVEVAPSAAPAERGSTRRQALVTVMLPAKGEEAGTGQALLSLPLAETARPAAHASLTPRRGLVTVMVPAKDEEAGIGQTLRSLPLATLHAAGFDTEVVVLDGHSHDATAAIARSFGATVVRDGGRGKGAAFRAARERCRGAYVVMIDADASYAPDALPRLVELLSRGEVDVVMGRRAVQAEAMTRSHRAGNALLSLAASALYGRWCRDVCTGLWGFRTEALRAMPLRADGFELEAELFAMASRLRLRIAQAPVDYMPRLGHAKLSALHDGARIAWWLLRFRVVPLGPRGARRSHRDRSPSPVPAARAAHRRTRAQAR